MPVAPVARRGRNTQGVIFARPGKDDSVVAVTDAPEGTVEETEVEDAATNGAPGASGAGAAVGSDDALVTGGEGDSQGQDAVPSEGNDEVASDAEAPGAADTDDGGGSA